MTGGGGVVFTSLEHQAVTDQFPKVSFVLQQCCSIVGGICFRFSPVLDTALGEFKWLITFSIKSTSLVPAVVRRGKDVHNGVFCWLHPVTVEASSPRRLAYTADYDPQELGVIPNTDKSCMCDSSSAFPPVIVQAK